MEPRRSLALAIGFGVLAILVVTVDIQYTLVLTLESWDGQAWKAVGVAPPTELRDTDRGLTGCAGPTLRVTLNNHRPLLAADRHVAMRYWNATGSNRLLFEEQWTLAPFETHSREATIPAAAFESDPKLDPRVPTSKQVQATVVAGDLSIYACVQEAP